jgi:glycosyltransferase involved in cell wall biosynthesis
MTIVVNAGLLGIPHYYNDRSFLTDCFTLLAAKFPHHQFIFITDNTTVTVPVPAKNIDVIAEGSQKASPLRTLYWLHYKIPALLRKYNATVYINSNTCCLRTKLPQCILLNDLSFLHHSKIFTKTWLWFYKKNMPHFLKKATAVITTSVFLKNQIIDTYKTEENKITFIHPCINKLFTPVSSHEKNNLLEKYTNGKEFFLYSGKIDTHQNLVLLLKAFSFFKKRQKSNMQLILASITAVTDPSFIQSLASYKYKSEVHVLGGLQQEALVKITAAAYALVYPVLYDGFSAAPLQAMQAGVPVITSNIASLPEVCGNAALYINPGDFIDIADKMMLVFKDENKRNELIEKGFDIVKKYNSDTTADALWQVILKCVNQPIT